MDYRRYCFRREEYIRYGLEAAGLSMVIAFCFYNSPVALILGIRERWGYLGGRGKRLGRGGRGGLRMG